MFSKLLQLYHKKASDPIFAFQYFLAVRFVVSLMVSIIMVKSALPADQLGYYEVIIFVVTSVSFFWSIGMKNALLSYYPSMPEVEKPVLLATVFWILTGFSLLVSVLFFIFDGYLVQLFTSFDFVPAMEYGALYLLVSVPLVLIENVLYLRGDARSLMKYSHWSHAVMLFFVGLAAIWSAELTSFFIAMILWSFIRWVYFLVFVFQSQWQLWNRKMAISFTLFSLPIILNVFLGSVMDMIDGLFVMHYFDEAFFPIFRYGAREMPFSTLLFSSLSAAMIPLLIKNGMSSSEVKVRVTRLMHFVFPVAILLMLLSPFIFPMVYNADFKQSAFIFNIYLLILTSRVLLPQAYNFALHQHKVIVWTSILEIIFNVLLSFWWVQYWGVYGLAMATVVAYFIQKILLVLYNSRINHIPLQQYLPIKWYIIYVSVMVVAFLISNFIY
ncbi:MAG TPA: oligosaccharide flippase family protein [Saprospiraceae bacterium]|nr:oligosaccharide flippase family protein [Saprospiraceae bacterium]